MTTKTHTSQLLRHRVLIVDPVTGDVRTAFYESHPGIASAAAIMLARTIAEFPAYSTFRNEATR